MDQIIRGKIPTYKGVELAATIGITIEESASKVTQEMENNILKAVNLTVGREIKIDKAQLIRWINMCKFLEEQATQEDRRVIGAWLAEVESSKEQAIPDEVTINRPGCSCQIGDWFYTVAFNPFEKKWTINKSIINRIAFDNDGVLVSNDRVEYYTLGENAFLNINECEKYMTEYELKFVNQKLI